jgi:mRNA-degrading endonuclease RelE of RelBE toxin-antitoxin system
MKVEYSDAVNEALEKAPVTVRRAFFKQIKMLEQNLRHPSLRAKKYDETNDRWQARVNKDWRFYFRIIDDTYHILKLIPHPKK